MRGKQVARRVLRRPSGQELKRPRLPPTMVHIALSASIACGQYSTSLASPSQRRGRRTRRWSARGLADERTRSLPRPWTSRAQLSQQSASSARTRASTTRGQNPVPKADPVCCSLDRLSLAAVLVQPLLSSASSSHPPVSPLDKRQATTAALNQLLAGPVTYVTTACTATCAPMVAQSNVSRPRPRTRPSLGGAPPS